MGTKIRLNDYADLIRITLQDMLTADKETNGSVLSVVPLGNDAVSVKINKKEYSFTLKELKPAVKFARSFLDFIKTKTGLH